VDSRALRFALESLAPGTVLDGARFEIEEPPGQAWCMGCGQTVAIAQRGDACPACGGYQLQATGGMELRVIDMEVE
jgi:hydrogenase nickel incorporation protein HypA/HybF